MEEEDLDFLETYCDELPKLDPKEIEEQLVIYSQQTIFSNDEDNHCGQEGQETSSTCSSSSDNISLLCDAQEETITRLEEPKLQNFDGDGSACSCIKKNSQELKKKRILLDDFLRKLLEDPRYNSYIQWTVKDRWEFKLIRPEMVAGLWGAFREKPLMNYDKLSRGLRYYYESKRIEKIPFKRNHFKFLNQEKHNSK
eukprot:gene8199-9077_t